MVEKGKGGANTLTGLNFEKKIDFIDLLKGLKGYSIQKSSTKTGSEVYFNETLVARCFKKYDFYKFFEENGINWQKIISKQLLPDDAPGEK